MPGSRQTGRGSTGAGFGSARPRGARRSCNGSRRRKNPTTRSACRRAARSPRRRRRRSGACRRVRRFASFFSRVSRTWRMSFSVSSSIDAFMSADASRARNVWPFSRTVASATWLSATDGFFSTASSISTRASSCTIRSSFPSFFSAYVRIESLTSRFLPLIWSCIGLPQVGCVLSLSPTGDEPVRGAAERAGESDDVDPRAPAARSADAAALAVAPLV